MVKAKRRQRINESVPVAPERGYINLADKEKNLLTLQWWKGVRSNSIQAIQNYLNKNR